MDSPVVAIYEKMRTRLKRINGNDPYYSNAVIKNTVIEFDASGVGECPVIFLDLAAGEIQEEGASRWIKAKFLFLARVKINSNSDDWYKQVFNVSEDINRAIYSDSSGDVDKNLSDLVINVTVKLGEYYPASSDGEIEEWVIPVEVLYRRHLETTSYD